MTGIRALLTIGIAALLLAASPNARAANLEALSDSDAQLYAAAFAAAERGDFAAVDSTLAQVSDPCLVGRVQYLKLIQPAAAHTASYTDLVGWLRAFKDLPGADRIYALAVKLKPAGDEPPAPSAASLAAAGAAERSRASNQYRPAREAYFDGDLNRALALAKGSGDVWIAGLASYRLQAFPQALGYFEAVARNTGENDWVRAGGAFWAARAADALGQGDRAQDFLRLAATLPDTFYGMVAARRLTLTDDPLGRVVEASIRTDSATLKPIKINAAGLSAPSVTHLVQTDPRARRAIALMQIGRALDAGLELRTGLAMAQGDDERSAWATLVYALNPDHLGSMAVRSAGPGLQNVIYPTPALNPAGGFTINRSLVYAVSWQESRFDAFAVSPVGAMGMMQVMPTTMAQMAGDDTLRRDPMPLFDGPTNLKLGQQYIATLMQTSAGNDIMKAVASYNGGPGVVSRAQAIVGADADSLMLMESLPFYETRAYVQKVMAAYWSYQRQFGGSTRTLDAVAGGSNFIDARLDH